VPEPDFLKIPDMHVTDCQLVASAQAPERFPRDGLPQIAFMGRSNVGKSSLINRLVGVRGAARTSKAPGRTRAIHFFRVNGNAYFVDLPGYGYARVPRPMREEWRGLVEAYLDGPLGPDLAVVLVDSRREPTDLDCELVDWLRSRATPTQVVLTKTDKISRGHRGAAAGRAAEVLELKNSAAPPLGVSAVTGDGVPALWRILDDAVAAGRRRSPHPVPPPSAGLSKTPKHHPASKNPPHRPTRGRTPQ
jgi:GTP-binding protein